MTARAPAETRCSIVGSVRSIRAGSATSPPDSGTLKSALSATTAPASEEG